MLVASDVVGYMYLTPCLVIGIGELYKILDNSRRGYHGKKG